ncbi:mycofactocin system glycosyltransferase [Enterobacter hormaechei]|uniref:glycosyltransferase family 2 protein n=1 Tax=Enterobacter cloacae complex TaxID=354276 RepID=UPI00063C7FA4|nr:MULTISPECIES: glycosyltransferase family 2 protein [Enterobacter cloacae complex]AVF15699.1 glycosyltransferase family 2 protein [Enterobacter cloacae complex sp.]QLV54425.1 glycosyltransferase family 2 protein [Enterobacter cloacae]HDS4483904.1 glycosyltransferase family 2 protein [Enterobacter hormaechei subsp. steigerwaltii]EHE7790857.1 glycosyltransferase family 2 protein [Enterobacter hormaechei]ELH2046293.1 glycosyltransferase family 2 protein [Enterobacter hormaechei]
MDVIVDGVPYVRVDSVSHNKIGIAITTHNRPQVLANSLEQHRKHLPPGAVVFVIDDGSNPPAKVPEWCNLIRHDKSRGIVASKNSSLECLMDSGCEHLFLWDDDAYAIADNWHLPYIESPELHLAYQFLDLAGQNKLNDLSVLYRDDQHVAYTGQRGVMLYYHRSAIEKVGGFDRVYGRGMYEHSDLALRIHNAGLTTWAYGDVVGSEKLIHSLDEHEAVERSVPRPDRQALVERNVKIHNERRDAGFTGYVEYRQQRDVVITTLLTSQPDPQRGTKMAASPDMLAKWASSLRNCGRIALVDELHAAPADVELCRVPDVKMNVYFRRWLHIWQHLREHPEYRFVWCTDGTDVEMLRAPWEEMEAGKVYVGSEPKTYADTWAKQNHPERIYQEFIEEHRNDVMLNAGLLGGTRADVMAFAHGIIRLYYRIESYRFWKKEQAGAAVGDMVAFGIVAQSFADRLVTGPLVHTVFKTEGIGIESAWFKHK